MVDQGRVRDRQLGDRNAIHHRGIVLVQFPQLVDAVSSTGQDAHPMDTDLFRGI